MISTMADFVPIMTVRAEAIMNMNRCNLPLHFLKEFDLPDLDACCHRLCGCNGVSEAIAMGESKQRELIRNPAFAKWLDSFLTLLPEEEPEKEPPVPSYARSSSRYAHDGYTVPRPVKPSRRSTLRSKLWDFLDICRKEGLDITHYPPDRVLEALSIDGFDSEKRLTLLESCKDTELCEDIRGFVISGIGNCVSLPLKLTQAQKKLLTKPCTASRILFSSAPFEDIWALPEACPGLLDITQLFHQFDICESLVLDDYKTMAQNAAGYYELLCSLASQMDADAMGLFTKFWQKGGCSLHELRRMERWISEHPGQDWDSLHSTYSGYINLLYGKRFKVMDLGETEGYQQSILIYAIIQSKKRFIRLVDENTDAFLALPPGSFLFQEDLYRKCLNLNELTERDLKDCAWMKALQLPADRLILGRQYSFQELRVLYGASSRCISLYNALCSESQDHRLKVFRQIRKRDILWKEITQQELSSLAANLDRKSLYDWLQEDFRHIRDLTAEDAARILAHLEEMRHLLPSLQNRNDVLLVLRNLDSLEQFHSVDSLKDGILQMDKSWLALLSEMKLSPEFLELHRENIIKFIYSNGAQIAETYRKCLDSRQQEAFFRIVKAELMGRLEEVKYFEGDLQRELNILLAPALLDAWKNNLHLKQDGMEAGEYDDFYSTMLLGVQPQKTCLSYIGGIYRECLLSSFDANKKILYVTLGGRVAGRAFLRLTKGRMAGAEPFSGARDRFTFVDLESVPESPEKHDISCEKLALFLERPYICGVGQKNFLQAERMLVRLACEKADLLGTALVLSPDYGGELKMGFVQTQFDIYISKSKAGMQYLDSLNGAASISREERYETGTFMVRKQ